MTSEELRELSDKAHKLARAVGPDEQSYSFCQDLAEELAADLERAYTEALYNEVRAELARAC